MTEAIRYFAYCECLLISSVSPNHWDIIFIMSKALQVGGGVLAGGYAVYAGMQFMEVKKIDKENSTVKGLVTNDQQKLAKNTRAITDGESKIAAVQQKSEQTQKELLQVDSELTAAREQVTRLEKQYKDKADSLAQLRKDAEATASSIQSLKSECQRLKEAVTTGEKSLQLLNDRRKEAELLYNPLNHPKVKKLLGR